MTLSTAGTGAASPPAARCPLAPAASPSSSSSTPYPPGPGSDSSAVSPCGSIPGTPPPAPGAGTSPPPAPALSTARRTSSFRSRTPLGLATQLPARRSVRAGGGGDQPGRPLPALQQLNIYSRDESTSIVNIRQPAFPRQNYNCLQFTESKIHEIGKSIS